MKTKGQELAEGLCNEIENDENGEEILRDLASRAEPTSDLSSRVETLADDKRIPKDRIWKALFELADAKVAGWDAAEIDKSHLQRFVHIAEQAKGNPPGNAAEPEGPSVAVDTSGCAMRLASIMENFAEEEKRKSPGK